MNESAVEHAAALPARLEQRGDHHKRAYWLSLRPYLSMFYLTLAALASVPAEAFWVPLMSPDADAYHFLIKQITEITPLAIGLCILLAAFTCVDTRRQMDRFVLLATTFFCQISILWWASWYYYRPELKLGHPFQSTCIHLVLALVLNFCILQLAAPWKLPESAEELRDSTGEP